MMRLIITLFLLAQGTQGHTSGNGPNATECKTACKDIRQDLLADVKICKPALKQTPVPKLFQACVEGRKKAFDQTCVSMCTSVEETLKKDNIIDSFDGCKTVVKRGQGPRYVDWCRRGYTDIVDKIETLFSENRESQPVYESRAKDLKEEQQNEYMSELESSREYFSVVAEAVAAEAVAAEEIATDLQEGDRSDSEHDPTATRYFDVALQRDLSEVHEGDSDGHIGHSQLRKESESHGAEAEQEF